ncbi:MAG TPA: hypothetical protein DCZ71_02480 [Ruminococcus sp.]|nr:hypothetical protein [Ruminococcus sp.]
MPQPVSIAAASMNGMNLFIFIIPFLSRSCRDFCNIIPQLSVLFKGCIRRFMKFHVRSAGQLPGIDRQSSKAMLPFLHSALPEVQDVQRVLCKLDFYSIIISESKPDCIRSAALRFCRKEVKP